MRVSLEGTERIAAPVQRVWERLLDAEFVATCAPGVVGVETVGPTEYRATAKIGIGSVSFKFGMRIELSDLAPPSHAAMRVRGTASGSALDATSTVALTPSPDGVTTLAWTAEADARGAIASTGARLLQGAAGKLTERFWHTFARKVEKLGP